jgi:hypothetical protein
MVTRFGFSQLYCCCLFNFFIEVIYEICLPIVFPADSRVNQIFKGSGLPFAVLSFGECPRLLEELFFREDLHTLPIDRKLIEPTQQIVINRGRHLNIVSLLFRVWGYLFFIVNGMPVLCLS